MSAELVIANYVRIASQDLEGAFVLAQAGNPNAAYLCQQAAEKLLRAVLTSEGIHGGTGHRLGPMVQMLPDANPTKPALSALIELEAYATTYRYPTSSRIPAKPPTDELQALLTKVRALLDDLVQRFGVDLQDQRRPARTASPPRYIRGPQSALVPRHTTCV